LELLHTEFWYEKFEGEKPLGRCRHRRENNIKMDLKEIGWEVMNLLYPNQDRD
jgi:hypothetical protein